jgi:TrmH family RNA methyltransferase
MLTVSTRNARFQQWQALLTNRTKRQRCGEFLVQGVRPISLAVEHGWPVRALLYTAGRRLSTWAAGMLDRVDPAAHVAMSPELLAELGDKSDGSPQLVTPELVAVVAMPEDRLDRLPPSGLAVLLDRPSNPGNVGTVIRSADAFGAAGVVVTGHAADPYDPRAVRASTGSLFAVPVVRRPGPTEVLTWARTTGRQIVGTDEHGDRDIAEQDLTGPTLVLVGNETVGLSAAWRRECDQMVRIPITGSASSLNAASAATVALYEAARQRGVQSTALPYISPSGSAISSRRAPSGSLK